MVKVKRAQQKKKYDWTVMVYMAGDNDLSEEMVMALQDIKELLHGETQKRQLRVDIHKLINQDPIDEERAIVKIKELFKKLEDDDVVRVKRLTKPRIRQLINERLSLELKDRIADFVANAVVGPKNVAIVAQLDPSGLGIPTQRYDFARPPKNAGDRLEDWRVQFRRAGEPRPKRPACPFPIDSKSI